MIMTILGALFPVFGLIVVGYFCGRYEVLGPRAFEVLNRFVISVTLPILTFRSIAQMDPRSLAVPSMFVAITGGAFLTYGLAFVIERRLGHSAAQSNIAAPCGCFSNTGFIGLPIAVLALGKDSIAPVAVAMLIYSAIVFTLGLVMSEVTASQGQGPREGARLAMRATLRSPLIVLSVVGVVWSSLRLPLNGPGDVLLSTLAQATAPCALTAIGIFIALPRETAAPAPVLRVTSFKLIVHPLITAALLWFCHRSRRCGAKSRSSWRRCRAAPRASSWPARPVARRWN